MVRRIFNLIHKEISGLHEAAYLLAVFALLTIKNSFTGTE